MDIQNITFIYDTADMCFIRQDKSFRELTIKGATERHGETDGTWFQVDTLTNHWISFRFDKYRLNTWKAFYKCVQNNEIKYHHRAFELDTNTLLVFSFAEADEWIKDTASGKWKSKF